MGAFQALLEETNWDSDNGCVHKIYTMSEMSGVGEHGWWQIKQAFIFSILIAKGPRRANQRMRKTTKVQKAYYARKYMEIHAADTNARVQSEIDEITSRMIDVEQQLLTAQNADDEVTLLQEELAMLQAERKAKRGSLVFGPMKKT